MYIDYIYLEKVGYMWAEPGLTISEDSVFIGMSFAISSLTIYAATLAGRGGEVRIT